MPDHVTVKDFDGNEIDRPTFKVDMDANAADKGAYPYYMLKEADEQPAVMREVSSRILW